MHFCDEFLWVGSIWKISIHMHHFDIFKCHMNNSRNHQKANFVYIANTCRTINCFCIISKIHVEQCFCIIKQSTSFPEQVDLKHMTDVWWPPICLPMFLRGTFHWLNKQKRLFQVPCYNRKWYNTRKLHAVSPANERIISFTGVISFAVVTVPQHHNNVFYSAIRLLH